MASRCRYQTSSSSERARGHNHDTGTSPHASLYSAARFPRARCHAAGVHNIPAPRAPFATPDHSSKRKPRQQAAVYSTPTTPPTEDPPPPPSDAQLPAHSYHHHHQQQQQQYRWFLPLPPPLLKPDTPHFSSHLSFPLLLLLFLVPLLSFSSSSFALASPLSSTGASSLSLSLSPFLLPPLFLFLLLPRQQRSRSCAVQARLFSTKRKGERLSILTGWEEAVS